MYQCGWQILNQISRVVLMNFCNPRFHLQLLTIMFVSAPIGACCSLWTFTENRDLRNFKNYKWRLSPVWHRMLYSCIGLDWIVQCFTSPPTQHRLYVRWFLQVKRPNQQYQSTEGNATRVIPFKMGQITKHFPGDHLQIAWNFNTLFMDICVGCVQNFT